MTKGYICSLETGAFDWPLELALRMQLVSDGVVRARDLVPEDKRELIDQLAAQEAAPTAGDDRVGATAGAEG